MILIIDNYDSFTYNLYQLVASTVMRYPSSMHNIQVARHDEITVPEIKHLNPQCILISPGAGRPEQAGISMDCIRVLGSTFPILGICLGLQAIACALGAELIQAPEICHGQSDLIFHTNQGLYKGLPSPFEAGRYHSLIVNRDGLPACLHVQAETRSGVIMGLRHAYLPIEGFQFHPESMLTPLGCHLFEQFFKRVHAHVKTLS